MSGLFRLSLPAGRLVLLFFTIYPTCDLLISNYSANCRWLVALLSLINAIFFLTQLFPDTSLIFRFHFAYTGKNLTISKSYCTVFIYLLIWLLTTETMSLPIKRLLIVPMFRHLNLPLQLSSALLDKQTVF